MPIIIDENLDETYELCNKHRQENCALCNQAKCKYCGVQLDEDNFSQDDDEYCEDCYEKLFKDDEDEN